MSGLKKKDKVYYTRILPSSGVYDVLELIIRTVEDDWFVGIEKRDKQAFLLYNNEFNKTVFIDRKDALKKVKDAESRKNKTVSNETFYEEY